jgi:hypothetical protein
VRDWRSRIVVVFDFTAYGLSTPARRRCARWSLGHGLCREGTRPCEMKSPVNKKSGERKNGWKEKWGLGRDGYEEGRKGKGCRQKTLEGGVLVYLAALFLALVLGRLQLGFGGILLQRDLEGNFGFFGQS